MKKYNSLFEKEMRRASFRKKFEETYPLFKIEAQILNELEKKGVTYLKLAKAVGTQKSNISRDLKRGGIHHATLDRIEKIANAINCIFLPLIIPKEKVRQIVPRIEKVVSHS